MNESENWRPKFGRFWSPSDWRIMSKAGLLDADFTQPELAVQEIIHRIRGMRDSWIVGGAAAGWLAALIFSWIAT